MAVKWKDKLTKKELEHVKEHTSKGTLKQITANVLFQQNMECPCWECVAIGRKIGIEVVLTAFHNRDW